MEGNNGIWKIMYFFQFKTTFLNKFSLKTTFGLVSALGAGENTTLMFGLILLIGPGLESY